MIHLLFACINNLILRNAKNIERGIRWNKIQKTANSQSIWNFITLIFQATIMPEISRTYYHPRDVDVSISQVDYGL
jgi:hypothetical protein